jgi:hypothetical protein
MLIAVIHWWWCSGSTTVTKVTGIAVIVFHCWWSSCSTTDTEVSGIAVELAQYNIGDKEFERSSSSDLQNGILA